MSLPFHKLLQTISSGSSIGSAAVAILASYGTDAHIYLPGVGALDGYTLGNYLDSGGTTPATVDNPVGLVQDAIGSIHVSQGTTASKPILRKGAVNLLTYSDAFTSGGWTLARVTVVANAVPGPLGQTTSYTMAFDGTTPFCYDRIAAPPGAYVGIYTLSIYVKKKDYPYVAMRNEHYAAFNLDTGTVISTAANVTATITAVGDGWFRLTNTCIRANVGTVYHGIDFCSNSGETNLVTVPTGLGVYISSAQLEVGSVASAYVPTTSATASNSVGNNYWEFDGVNDSLGSAAAPFQISDDHCVIMGVSRNTVGPEAYPFVVASNGTWDYLAAAFALTAGGGVRAYWRDGAAVLVSAIASGSYSAGSPMVVSARKTGHNKVCRLNGSPGSTDSTVMASPVVLSRALFSNYSTSYFDGCIYPVITIKGTVSDADLLILERWVGSFTGPTGVAI